MQPEAIAEAIVEAIETGRYEVFVPRLISSAYKATRLLPLRATDAIMRIVTADTAMLHAIDSPERHAYEQRIALADREPRRLDPGHERR